MKALALDFDGVIADSAPEAYVVAVRAFRAEFPESGWIAECVGRAWAYWEPKDWPKAAEWYTKAVRLMPHEKECASNLWSALKEPVGCEALSALLVERYEVGGDLARADVKSLIEELSARGLVEATEDGVTP